MAMVDLKQKKKVGPQIINGRDSEYKVDWFGRDCGVVIWNGYIVLGYVSALHPPPIGLNGAVSHMANHSQPVSSKSSAHGRHPTPKCLKLACIIG